MVTGAKRILAEAEESEARIRLCIEKLSGTVHVSAPSDMGRNQIVPLLDQFMEVNPEIKIALTLSDGYVDLVGTGIDLALRFGALPDSTMKSRRLGANRRVVRAASDYLKTNRTPQHPNDLAHHNCLIMRFGTSTDQNWNFLIVGQMLTCRVNGNRTADDGGLIRRWCLSGYGIALKSEWDVRSDLAAGRLVEVLEEFAQEPNALQMVYPAGAVQPHRVRALMDFLSEKLVLE